MKLLTETYHLHLLWDITPCRHPTRSLTSNFTILWSAAPFENGIHLLACPTKSGSILSLVPCFAMGVQRCTLWMVWMHMLLMVYVSRVLNSAFLSRSRLSRCVSPLMLIILHCWHKSHKFTPKNLLGSTSQPPPELMQFHPNSNPPPSFDVFLTSMIGRAFLEWNSDVGVSVDVWRILSTSGVVCGGCDKVRSLDGDCAHRNAAGMPLCETIDISDNEDENISPMDKGKGRAFN
jgi:hypothetical protein